MDISLCRYWWLVGLQGLAAVVYGLLALFLPFATLGALILLFAAFALVYGVFAVVDALGSRRASRIWWFELINGLAAIAAGVLAFIWPGITALALLWLVAAWAIVVGIFELIAAFRPEFPGAMRWAFGLAGAASLLVGLLLVILRPAEGLLALVWLIGMHALVNGVLWLFRAYRMWSIRREGGERGARGGEAVRV